MVFDLLGIFLLLAFMTLYQSIFDISHGSNHNILKPPNISVLPLLCPQDKKKKTKCVVFLRVLPSVINFL